MCILTYSNWFTCCRQSQHFSLQKYLLFVCQSTPLHLLGIMLKTTGSPQHNNIIIKSACSWLHYRHSPVLFVDSSWSYCWHSSVAINISRCSKQSNGIFMYLPSNTSWNPTIIVRLTFETAVLNTIDALYSLWYSWDSFNPHRLQSRIVYFSIQEMNFKQGRRFLGFYLWWWRKLFRDSTFPRTESFQSGGRKRYVWHLLLSPPCSFLLLFMIHGPSIYRTSKFDPAFPQQRLTLLHWLVVDVQRRWAMSVRRPTTDGRWMR